MGGWVVRTHRRTDRQTHTGTHIIYIHPYIHTWQPLPTWKETPTTSTPRARAVWRRGSVHGGWAPNLWGGGVRGGWGVLGGWGGG